MPRRRFRNVLTVLENEARKYAGATRADWTKLSNSEREWFRQRASRRVTGTARLVRTDISYRRCAA